MRRVSILVFFALAAGCRGERPASPEASVAAIAEAVQASDGAALWRQVPPSMKAELAGLVARFQRQAAPTVPAALRALVTEADHVLAGERARLERLPPLQARWQDEGERRRFARALVDLIAAGASANLFGAGTRAEDSLERVGPALASFLLEALRAADSPLAARWEPGPFHCRRAGDRASCRPRKDAPGEIMIRVDGGWWPARWAQAWTALMKDADGWLGGADSSLLRHAPQITGLLEQSRLRLRRAQAAPDQSTFDGALSGAAGTLSLALTWTVVPK
jgi:hypothetical protein